LFPGSLLFPGDGNRKDPGKEVASKFVE